MHENVLEKIKEFFQVGHELFKESRYGAGVGLMQDNKSKLGAGVGDTFSTSFEVLEIAPELLISGPLAVKVSFARGGGTKQLLLVNIIEHRVKS